jgi:hypothetical protein
MVGYILFFLQFYGRFLQKAFQKIKKMVLSVTKISCLKNSSPQKVFEKSVNNIF